jgi:UrcA family protein
MLIRKAMISLGLAAASLIISSTAIAQARTVSVKVSDLDLANAAGQERLEQRVIRAARTVCSSDTRSARDHATVKTCEAKAIANAEPKIAARIAASKSQRGIAINSDLKLASD